MTKQRGERSKNQTKKDKRKRMKFCFALRLFGLKALSVSALHSPVQSVRNRSALGVVNERQRQTRKRKPNKKRNDNKQPTKETSNWGI